MGRNPNDKGANRVGEGFVYWGGTLKDALELAEIEPDVSLENSDVKSSNIYFAHRKLDDADVYFIDNHKDSAENNLFSFSAKGKYVQVWNPVSGERFSLPAEKISKDKIGVRLLLAARESYFVVISNNPEKLPLFDKRTLVETKIIEGAWEVYFDKKMGGPGKVTFQKLQDWTEFSDPRIKYYSGVAVYKKQIAIDSKNKKVTIDLGNPNFIAQLLVNGKDVGIVWCSPWQLDITPYLRQGENILEIRVANSLMNRMIYDVQLPEKDRVTFSYPVIASSSDNLEPSGLTEVKLLIEDEKPIK